MLKDVLPDKKSLKNLTFFLFDKPYSHHFAFCVLGNKTLRHFPRLGSFGKQTEINFSNISKYKLKEPSKNI